MVDKIQKVTILQKDLPQLTKNGQYFFRYRIKNKANTIFSNWSQKYNLNLTNSIYSIVSQNPVKYLLSQIANQNIVHLSWTMPTAITVNNFDIYLKWYYGSTAPTTLQQSNTAWIMYSNTITGPMIDLEVPTNATYLQVAVMLQSYPKFTGNIIDNEVVLLFKTNLTKIPIPVDGGVIG